ncbi:MAG: alpha/beta fold hydrolase [Gemmatimonadaceae bacterium]
MTELHELAQTELGSLYTIERELSGGGMARVFLAEERKLGRKVVLKVLAPELAETISAERFAREILVAARLQQANIVPVLTAGQIGAAPYYTMPYIAGSSLRELLGAGPLPLALATSIMRDVMRALTYAHGEEIAHRDIKPENVLLSGDTAVVTDFGIAKALAASRTGTGDAALTQLGMALGTPAYMAPEQASGDDVDHRADIYSWGVVAYELLTGTHPFGRKTSSRAYIAAHIVQTPESLETRRPDCPPGLAALVMSCLEKDRTRRPSTARSILAEMESATGTAGSPARATASKHRVETRAFKLTDEVCRRIDRALLDPRIIGGEMTWLHNDAESDTLVLCLHGTGLDAGIFREVLENLPYRVAALTFFGLEPEAAHRVPLPFETHLALLRELIASVTAELRPRRTILLGFSSGGDAVLRILADPASRVFSCDAAVSLGANLALETCWITRRLSGVQSGGEASLLANLRTMAAGAGTLTEWLNIHEYLVRVLRKFQGDMEPLRLVSSGIARPFEEGDKDVFPAWFRAVTARVPVVICVSEDDPTCRALIQELRLRHIDSGLLGENYRDDALVLDPADHFGLIGLPCVQRYVDEAVSRLESNP